MLRAKVFDAGSSECLRPLILLGAGGHAKVLLSLLRALNRDVMGICDPGLAAQSLADWRGARVLGDDAALDQIDPAGVELINGMGQLTSNCYRQMLHQKMKQKGFVFATVIHPAAWVDESAQLAEGVQVMAGAVIQADCVVAEGSIINTKASVDHDCRIGEHVHIAPGATLCGGVVVGREAFIGSGATVIQSKTIGSQAVVAAGAVVARDVPAGQLLMGATARLKRRG